MRAIGPAVSWLAAMGMMPACETSPIVGLMPTTFCSPAGHRIDPSVSVPTASVARLAATTVAEPDDDPHGSRSSEYGLRVKPPRALHPLNGANPRKFAHSDRLALPSTMAPASRRRATIGASRRTLLPTSAREPAVVSIRSSVAMLSFTITGMPWSGPRRWWPRRCMSSQRAIFTASGLVSITAPSNGFNSSIRARYHFTSSVALRSRAFIAAWSWATVASCQSS